MINNVPQGDSEPEGNAISHRSDYGLLVINADYVEIVNGDICSALLLTSIEDRTAKLAKNEFAPLSYDDFHSDIYGMYGRNSIIKRLKQLQQDKLIHIGQHTDLTGYAYQYRLNTSVVQKLLDNLPLKVKSKRSKNLQTWQIQKLEEFNGKCAYCQVNIANTWDHIIADANGGTSSQENLIPACAICNSSKANRNVHKWITSKGFIVSSTLLKAIGQAEDANPWL